MDVGLFIISLFYVMPMDFQDSDFKNILEFED